MRANLALTASVLAVTLSASAAVAQLHPPLPVGTKIAVKRELAATPNEQIARQHKKIYALKSIADPRERLAAVLEVMSNLALVPERWPEANDAVLQSYLMQADLALQYSMTKNAVDVLTAALRRSERTQYYVDVEQKLALAYERLGDLAAAEAHLLAAERSPSFRSHPLAATVLQQLGMLYSRGDRPREAMDRFRTAAHLPRQHIETKTSYLLSVLKEAVRLKDDAERAEAKAAVVELERAIADVRKAEKHDQRRIAGYEHDLFRLKKQFGL